MPKMPRIYWMLGYNIRQGMVVEYQKFMASKAFKEIVAGIERETGIKYVETYGSIIPSTGDEGYFDAYDLWEMPNHAAFDKLRNSPSSNKLVEMTYKYTEPRPGRSMVLRKYSDVKVFWEPKKK